MRKLFALAVAVLISAMAWSVTPEKMSYQAVIRNGSEQLVVNKKVGMRISILQNSETGTAVYSETQTPTTNANGLVSLEIGAGISVNDFSAIDWSKGPFFIKTETDLNGGTNYTISGVSQLLSVPYALHAKTVEIDKVDDADADPINEIQTLSLSGTSLTLSKNGGTVTLPSSGGGDNWGTQTAVTNATLEGNGSTASPLKIAQQGATAGQTLKWNGTAWAPSNETREDTINEIQTLSLSGTSLTLSKNGGTVTLPSSGGGDNWGTQTAVTNETLEGNGSTALPLKIAQQGATAGQTLKWNGSAWTPGDDAKGAGLILPYSESVSNPDFVFSISNSLGSSIKGESSSPTGTGVFGGNSSPTGYPYGVAGYTCSPHGISVYADNTSSGIGVFGSSVSGTGVFGSSIAGTGVFGRASQESGTTYGVNGTSFSPDGVGVYGHNDAQSGSAIGVKGESASPDGTGISGINSSDTGYTFGVVGTTSSPNGKSVYGNNFSSGNGVYGSSVSGTGVSGHALLGSGATYGVTGSVISPEGIGVYGHNDAGSGYAIGVKGESASKSGAGVYGTNSNTTGHNYGVMGEINSTGGTAVYGENWAESGNACGTVGVSFSPSGVGVYGGNGAETGDAYGIKGESASSSGTGVYGIGKSIGVHGYSEDGIGVYGFGHKYAGYFEGKLVALGGVGICTTIINPDYQLNVHGKTNTGEININCDGKAITCNGNEAVWYNGDHFSWGYGCVWNAIDKKVFIGPGSTDPGANMLVVNGAAAKPGGGTWATWSDIRLKDIQGNYEKGLSEVIKLKPVKFNYKAGNSCNLPSDQNYVGFIAQDVQKVFPEAVSEGKDGYLSLDANAINVALVNAVKELKAENDKLKAENKKFEDRLSKIEKLLGEGK